MIMVSYEWYCYPIHYSLLVFSRVHTLWLFLVELVSFNISFKSIITFFLSSMYEGASWHGCRHQKRAGRSQLSPSIMSSGLKLRSSSLVMSTFICWSIFMSSLGLTNFKTGKKIHNLIKYHFDYVVVYMNLKYQLFCCSIYILSN